jgi:type II secretory pathway pseudopilin PulG
MPRLRRTRGNRERVRNERGSTLVELLVATTIMGIAVVGLLVGSSVTFQTSGQNRTQTNAGIVARNYAESLSGAVTTSNWCQTTAAGYGPSYTVPTGYLVNTVFGACPAAGAAQFQDVTITVTASGDTETLKSVVRLP